MRVTIEKLVYGGLGLARTEQGVVFVPRTAPGDVVEIELVDRKADYAQARVTALIEASPDRQAPQCPNYETAGCCHWQHIRYSRQLEIKEGILRETLRRVGKIEWEAAIPAVSGPELNYRLRADFHVADHRLAFVEERSHKVVPILECSALSPELNGFIPVANELLARPEHQDVREVQAVSAPVLAAFGKKVVGQPPTRVRVHDCTFDLHPLAFFQSNRFLLADFLQEVLKRTEGARRIVDLFCGCGFFSIPLAKRGGEVLGVESSRIAVNQARLNAKLNGIANAEFFEGSVEETLRSSSKLRPDLVLLNPPRAGAGRAAVELATTLEPPRIVYVSCNPSTFAREAVVLIGRNYRLESVTMVDQFPGTYHIELVAAFRKG